MGTRVPSAWRRPMERPAGSSANQALTHTRFRLPLQWQLRRNRTVRPGANGGSSFDFLRHCLAGRRRFPVKAFSSIELAMRVQ
jgi:hypothetical protein